MGPHESSNKIFLKASLGKLRKKCDATMSKAVARTLEDGTIIHEILYTAITGILDGIAMREHPEYGKSWTIFLTCDKDEYGVQVSENSRYGMDLLRKIPNLKKGTVYTFTPYDFEADGDRKSGLSIKTEAGDKVQSFYQTFTKDGEKNVVTNINGFPDFTGDKKDKDDWKIYFAQVTKILRQKATAYLDNEFVMNADMQPTPNDQRPIPDKPEDDLPF